MGLRGLRALNLIGEDYQPRYQNKDKRLITIVETDGCGLDGIATATGCSVGRRTLRVLDFGKIAATLVDTWRGSVVRVTPSPQSRELALVYAKCSPSPWHAYLEAYQIIPDHQLVRLQPVKLTQSIEEIMSKPDARVNCAICGEEIINEREVCRDGLLLCRSCAGDGYYQAI